MINLELSKKTEGSKRREIIGSEPRTNTFKYTSFNSEETDTLPICAWSGAKIERYIYLY